MTHVSNYHSSINFHQRGGPRLISGPQWERGGRKKNGRERYMQKVLPTSAITFYDQVYEGFRELVWIYFLYVENKFCFKFKWDIKWCDKYVTWHQKKCTNSYNVNTSKDKSSLNKHTRAHTRLRLMKWIDFISCVTRMEIWSSLSLTHTHVIAHTHGQQM